MRTVLERSKPKREKIEAGIKLFLTTNPDVERFVIEIKEDKDSRSTKQNRLYWEWCGLIGESLGYNKDEVHVLLGDKFLDKIIVQGKHKTIEQIPSTTTLKVSEFKEYLEQIDMMMAEYGIMLPRPEDLYYESMGITRS